MIFSQDMAQAIIAGQKTQTRRRVDSGDYLIEAPKRTVIRKNRKKWQVGKVYAAQTKRGGRAVAYIRLTDIRAEPFSDISQPDAIAEGFSDAAGFFAKIRALYGDDFNMFQVCWAPTFELVGERRHAD